MLERDVENLLEQMLKKAGFIVDVSNPKRNVYFQSPRTEEEKGKLKGKKPDFCIYFDNTSTSPDIIIETKKPNMSLSSTLEQAIDYANKLGSKIVILYDGIEIKHFWFTKEEMLYNNLPIKEIKDKNFYKRFLTENSAFVYEKKEIIRSKEDLIKIFAYANQKLRKAGITKGMQRFFEFSNILFLKLISEENDIISEKIPEYIKWESYKNKNGEELLEYINKIVIPTLEDTFNKNNEEPLLSPLKIKDTKILKEIIERLDKVDLKGIETDIKGDAFEYFIQQYNNTNNDLGEYFTPRHIVKFLVKLAKPKYNETIYDPFCGTGGMLIASFNYIKEELEKQNFLDELTLEKLKHKTLYGREISDSAKIAKMNMILTGDGHSNVKQIDSLKNPVEKEYDIVITNIPFNLEGTANESLYFLKSKNGNIQAIEHIIKSLKPQGRAYVIVPEAILNNPETKKLRKWLIENNLITQIISLPAGVFLPYTEAKASILVLQGFNSKKVSKLKYTLIRNDGFTLTQRRRKLNGINDLDEYLADNEYNSYYIEIEKIKNHKDSKRKNDYSFLWFKYFNQIPKGYILLKDVGIEEKKIKNSEYYDTVTISNNEFWGIANAKEYWGENFVSVTSNSNEKYKVVKHKWIAYNPSRANVGSFGINLSDEPVAVSPAYIVFEVKNYLPEYVFLYLKSKEGINYIKERSYGSVRQLFRFEDLLNIPIPKIGIKEQKKVIKKAKELYKNYNESKKQLQNEIYLKSQSS